MTDQVFSAIAFVLALGLSSALWKVSAAYRQLFSQRERMVMNWGLDGKPTSWASPQVGLAITPAVGTLFLFLIAGFGAFATPAEERLASLGMLVLAGLVLLAVHAVHLHFAASKDKD